MSSFSKEETAGLLAGSQPKYVEPGGEDSDSPINGIDQASFFRHSQTNKIYIPRRFFFTTLLCLGLCLAYLVRVNISIASVTMANEFHWSEQTKGNVLSSFYYGYLCNQLTGGKLADKFGGKMILLLGLLWATVFTLLTPLAAHHSLSALYACRFLLGFGESVTYPSAITLCSKWLPKNEQSLLISIIYSGATIGTIIALPVSPIIITHLGWEWNFYLFAFFGILWCTLFFFFTADTPAKLLSIDPRERVYIERRLAIRESPSVVPWKKILTTPAVWAIVVANFSQNWSTYVLLSWLPTFYTERFDLDLESSGFLSVLPYLSFVIVALLVGRLSDVVLRNGVALLRIRKFNQACSGLLPACLFIAAGYAKDGALVVSLLTAAIAFGAFANAGYGCSHLDIAPQFAGYLMGLSNTAGTIPGIVGVQISGYILDQTNHDWSYIFFLTSSVLILGVIVWLIFAKAHVIIRDQSSTPDEHVSIVHASAHAGSAEEPRLESKRF